MMMVPNMALSTSGCRLCLGATRFREIRRRARSWGADGAQFYDILALRRDRFQAAV
jgi:hypothetical protein